MFGPKITEAPADGKMPWSTTVVNINRMRARRRRRLIMLGALVVIPAVLCVACGLGAKIYTGSRSATAFGLASKPTAAPARPAAVAKPTAAAIPTATAKPTAAAIPTATAEPVVATAFIAPLEGGPPGATVQIAVSSDSAPAAAVIVWWDNTPAVRGQLADGQGLVSFNVPADAAPGQHTIVIDVSNGTAIKSISVKFNVFVTQ